MQWKLYGSDNPDTRFGMKFLNLSEKTKGSGFKIFDSSESIYGFTIENGESFSRKDIDYYSDWVKRPQIGSSWFDLDKAQSRWVSQIFS